MKIRGEIYIKRTYLDNTIRKPMSIFFIKTDETIDVNGEMIKFIPMISDCSLDYSVGEKVEVNGKISMEHIITSMGKRTLEPIPVIRSK